MKRTAQEEEVKKGSRGSWRKWIRKNGKKIRKKVSESGKY